jgi:hypothetical protein
LRPEINLANGLRLSAPVSLLKHETQLMIFIFRSVDQLGG